MAKKFSGLAKKQMKRIRSSIRAFQKRNEKHKVALRFASIFIVLLVFAGIAIFIVGRNKAVAGWWDDNWEFRKPITITNSSGSDQTDYQVMITLDTASLISAGKMQSDCDDIRITESNGKVLPHWIEEMPTTKDCNSSTTNIWTKIPTAHQSGNTIYLYYGNASAINTEDGSSLFILFDDFNGSSLDRTKWYEFGDGSFSVTGGHIYPTSYGATCSGTGWRGQAITAIVPGSLTGNFAYAYYADIQNSGSNTYLGTMSAVINADGVYDQDGYLSQTYDASYVSANGSQIGSSVTNNIYSNTAAGWTDFSGKVEIADDGTNGHMYINDTEYGTAQTHPSLTFNYLSAVLLRYCNSNSWLPALPKNNLYAIAVRKYVTNGPTAGSPGTEESTPGTIGYWRFDEGYGTTVNDSTLNNNDGTITEATWQSEDMCISGKCLSYDGSNDTVTVPANTFINQYNQSGYTVCGWIKPISDGEGNAGEWWSKGGSYLRVDTESSGTVKVSAAFDLATTDATYNSTSTIPLSSWTHICATYTDDSDDEITVYINGQLAGTSTNGVGSLASDTSSDLYIGGDSSNNFHGFIDEVKMYPYERTADQVKTDYVKQSNSTGSAVQLSSPANQGEFLNQGLVGYWKMDEASWNGTTGEVKDTSGNGNNGTRAGDATTAIGKFGNGGTFDGTGDYVDLGDPDSLAVSSAVTFSAYVKPNTFVNGEVIYYGGAGDKLWVRLNSSGQVETYFGGTTSPGYHTSTGSLTNGAWNQITVMFDGQLAKVFINGIHDSTITTTGTLSNSGTQYSVKIGSNYNGGGNYFIGSIDETRIYNRALSPAEVQKLYNWAPGPISYWNFNEGSGSIVNDSSSNQNTGSFNGTGSHWTLGKFGHAGQFNGTNDYVSTTTSYSNPRNFTLSAWIKTSVASGHKILGFETNQTGTSSPQWDRQIYIGTDGKAYFGCYDTDFRYAISTNSVNDGDWHHLTATSDSVTNKIELFVDGILQQSTTGGCYNYTGYWRIGGYKLSGWTNASDGYYSGAIDHVSIYNYIRTQEQVISDMNAGHPAPGSPVGSAYIQYRFDEGNGSTAHNAGSGGSSLDGSITSGTWDSSGKHDKAITLTGSSSVTATIADPGYTNTISLWVYPTTSAASKTLVTSGKLATNGSSQPTYGNCTGTALSLSTWTHIVAVSNGSSSCAIYQNGKLTSSSTTGVTFGTSLNIGGSSFTGSVDEFKFFNSALTESQVALLFNNSQGSIWGAFSTDSSGIPSNSSNRSYCPPGDTTANCGPVSEWSFDEGSGQYVNDTSGNGNQGTLGATSGSSTDDPTWVDGKIGKALDFDGSNDYVNIPSFTPSGSGALSFWVKPGAVQDRLLGSNGSFEIRVNSGQLRADIFESTAGADWTSNIQVNTWSFITVTWDDSGTFTRKLYFNGKLEVINTDPKDSVSTSDLWIGASNGSTEYFDGLIDKVRIYNYTLTPAEVAWDYNHGAPVAYYNLDECSGSTVHSTNDFYDSGLNGTIVEGGTGTNVGIGTCTGSAGTMWKDGVSGKVNSSLEFDGADDYVTLGDLSILDNSTQASVSLWYKTSINPTDQRILFDKQSNLRIEYLNSKLQVLTGDSSSWKQTDGEVAVANSELSTSTWHFVTLVFDGQNTSLYVDTKLKDTATDTAFTMGNNSSPFAIGDYGGSHGTYNFNGQIDEVKIYNYALTDSQIKSVYNNGAANFSN